MNFLLIISVIVGLVGIYLMNSNNTLATYSGVLLLIVGCAIIMNEQRKKNK